MKCPHCRQDISEFVAKSLGSKGGKANSEAQREQRRAAGLAPCAPGKKRGRPSKAEVEARKKSEKKA